MFYKKIINNNTIINKLRNELSKEYISSNEMDEIYLKILGKKYNKLRYYMWEILCFKSYFWNTIFKWVSDI